MCVQTFRIEINSGRLDGNIINSELEQGMTIYHIIQYSCTTPAAPTAVHKIV